MEVGCLKKKMNCILIYQFLAFYLYFVHHKRCMISVIFLGNFWILSRLNIDQLSFFPLVGYGVCFHQQTSIYNNIAFCVFLAISEFIMESCSLKFLWNMLPNISKQQKKTTSHTGLNNFPAVRNYHDINFALLCMDNKYLLLNEVKFDLKFCEIEK